MEVVYAAGFVADFDPRFYQVNRRRVGFTSAFDFKQGNSSLYGVRAVYNRYIDDHENRQRYRQRVANRRIERELRDRTHIERIASLSFDGKHTAGNAEIDYKVLGAYSDQVDPLTMTTIFRQANVNFLPNVTPTSIDPDNIQTNPQNENLALSFFNSQLRATNFSKDRDIVGAVNLRLSAHERQREHVPEGRRQVPRQEQGPEPQRDPPTRRRASLPIVNYLDAQRRSAAVSRRPLQPAAVHQPGSRRQHSEPGADDGRAQLRA